MKTIYKLLLWSFTVALVAFLFGLDVAVISGAETNIQKLWKLSGPMHGLAISIACMELLLALHSWLFCRCHGTKKSFFGGLFFFVSH